MNFSLLDIDGVLLHWDSFDPCADFDDWKRPNVEFFNWFSPSKLELIKETLGDTIRWHTTWIDGNMCNEHWVKHTGFGPFPTLLSEIGKHQILRPSNGLRVAPDDRIRVSRDQFSEEVEEILHNHDWWKLNAVAAALSSGVIDKTSKVVWMDDDLVGRLFHGSVEVLELFGVRKNFLLIPPVGTLTKAQIKEAGRWVNP